MDNEPEVIRQQMEDTRQSLQEKLETLEQQVKETVQDAAEAANETVQTVKEAVQETVDTVKDTVQETVVTVKQSLDIRLHVHEHPWPMFLGAVAVGYVGGRLLTEETGPPMAMMSTAAAPTPTGHNGHHNGRRHHGQARRQAKGFLSQIADRYSDELNKLQGLAVGAVTGIIREMLTSISPAQFTDQIKEIVDGVTTKLGGKPVRGPIFQASAAQNRGEPHERSYDPNEARTVAPTEGRRQTDLGGLH
jgi:ElaB/YqjD/DUF883 family membrane-anchored ribosome-binding protein